MKIGPEPVYLDTSALAKIYVPEPESNDLESALIGKGGIIVSDLAVTELVSVLAKRVRKGQTNVEAQTRVYQQLLNDLATDMFKRVGISHQVHTQAEQLIMSLGRTINLRAADALHLALASSAGARTLVTFDRTMKTAATTMGMFEISPR